MTESVVRPGRAGSPQAAAPSRREYLDWLRGIAVLIMIEAHVVDAWTRPADRTGAAFAYALILGGMGAPLFLFLAGVSVALAGDARERRLGSAAAAAGSVRRRGLQIFAYAFLFRLQSFLLNPGSPLAGLLKVDILNIMGPAIVLAASLWQWGRTPAGRLTVLAAVTFGFGMVTPPVRTMSILDGLPAPIVGYLRPTPGWTNFTLFPWAGFVTAGTLCGLALTASSGPVSDRRAQPRLLTAGVLVTALGYWTSFLPPLYANSGFWTSSPTFFFLRCGLLTMALPAAYAWSRRGWRPTALPSPVTVLGRSSLFVYWVHVEMVYGVLSTPLHRTLPREAVWAAFLLFTGFMLLLVFAKDRVLATRRARSSR